MFWKNKNETFISKYKVDKEICTGLINLFKKTPFGHKGKLAGNIGNYQLDKTRKSSTDLGIFANHVIKHKVVREYFEELALCLNKYMQTYRFSDEQHQAFQMEGANIQEYKPGQGFKSWHFENAGDPMSSRRNLVFMTYLNTVPYGGTEFFYQNKRFKAVIGDTLIWPASWNHTHKGEISKKQTKTKYIITGWWHYERK